MGQTLMHGVYLPDEGERNCYNGLAANWQLLDGAVGTVAEHTTQIAGKAPLVHTHTKSDITDFPAYGTTAGTICEGNDSRLSDARTPLSHTHTKSDITDFPAYGTTAGTICEGNDSRLSDARTPVAHTHTKSDVTDLFNSANTWTGENTFSNLNPIILKNSNIEKGVQPTNSQAQSILFKDKNDSNVAYIRHFINKSGTTNFNADGLEFSIANKFTNGALDPTGTNTSGTFRIGFWTDGQKYIYNEFRWRSSLIPFNNQDQNIGTSTNQWNNLYAKTVNTQSVNGGNPGALSLPNINTSIAVDTTNWVYDGATFNEIKINNATQTISGWLYIIINNASSDDVIVVRYAGSDSGNLTYAQYKSGLSYVSLVAPIMPGVKTYVASRKAFSTIKIYHSLGNV